VFAFAMITVYLIVRNKNYLMSLIPGMFYAYVIFSYILNAKIGFNLSLNISYIISAPLTLLYAFLTIKYGKKLKEKNLELVS